VTSAAIYQARQALQRAHWAGSAFASYDRPSVLAVAEAVARAAHAQARHYAEWAVRETGFGVVEDKVVKNEACSLGILERYRDEDLVSPRIDQAGKMLSLPRPAGVILALTPSTNPVCSVFFKVILAMLTRNAIVISPHPMARECCADAARMLAAAATAAGAPDGVIQVVAEPTVPLIEALMSDPATSVINPDCRVHGITNLFITDASFMPTSAGINPATGIIPFKPPGSISKISNGMRRRVRKSSADAILGMVPTPAMA